MMIQDFKSLAWYLVSLRVRYYILLIRLYLSILGVGSGISLKLSDYSFNLVTLYSNVQSIRQRQNAENRVLSNKLFDHHHHGDDDHGRATMLHEVKPAIQELVRKSQGFVFVVDASRPIDESKSFEFRRITFLFLVIF